ncbi:MAG: hypothetical protein U1A77_10335 [Pirellulales bacterium]
MLIARPLGLALMIVVIITPELLAGMAIPLPDDWTTIARFSENGAGRLQAISFFAVTILLATWIVKGLWNFIASDSQWLPRISFAKAAAVVLLWGVAFVVVLTMIAGARELLTPGAWKKNGITYTLESDR